MLRIAPPLFTLSSRRCMRCYVMGSGCKSHQPQAAAASHAHGSMTWVDKELQHPVLTRKKELSEAPSREISEKKNWPWNIHCIHYTLSVFIILHKLSGYKCINTNLIPFSIWHQAIRDYTKILFSFVNTIPDILQSQNVSRSQSKFILLKKGPFKCHFFRNATRRYSLPRRIFLVCP